LPHGNCHISHYPLGLNSEEDTILYIHPDRHPTIQTGRIDPNRLPWEKPADRQRFKSSLTKPLLRAIDRQAILRGKIVEGGKRDDRVSPREQPRGDSQAKELMVLVAFKKIPDMATVVPS